MTAAALTVREAAWKLVEHFERVDAPARDKQVIAEAVAALSAPANQALGAVQEWVSTIPLMQQSVLLSAIRGPDGSPKYGTTKMLVRWLRRCVLLGSFERAAFRTPHELGGGSFTGPSISRDTLQSRLLETANAALAATLAGGSVDQEGAWDRDAYARLLAANDAAIIAEFDLVDGDWTPFMDQLVSGYLRGLDALPHHFQLHFMHAAEILGYKHPDEVVRGWWRKTYDRLAHDMHLWPETEEQLDARLGDNREGWLARNDAATVD